MSDEAGLEAFFAKAESREPLLRAALGFVPMQARPTFKAWTGLLAELRECAFELSDPRVTALKAGWWAEELDGMARGAARHPLGRALLARDLPRAPEAWAAAAAALPVVASDIDPAPDTDAALDALRPLAAALIAIERALFGATLDRAIVSSAPDRDDGAQGRALALHWLRHRLECGLEGADRARVPLALFARHGLRRERLASPEAAALRRDWAAQLSAEAEALLAARTGGWPYPRLLSLASDRRALAAFAAGREAASGRMQSFLDVARAWRLARNAALQPRPAVASPT